MLVDTYIMSAFLSQLLCILQSWSRPHVLCTQSGTDMITHVACCKREVILKNVGLLDILGMDTSLDAVVEQWDHKAVGYFMKDMYTYMKHAGWLVEMWERNSTFTKQKYSRHSRCHALDHNILPESLDELLVSCHFTRLELLLHTKKVCKQKIKLTRQTRKACQRQRPCTGSNSTPALVRNVPRDFALRWLSGLRHAQVTAGALFFLYWTNAACLASWPKMTLEPGSLACDHSQYKYQDTANLTTSHPQSPTKRSCFTGRIWKFCTRENALSLWRKAGPCIMKVPWPAGSLTHIAGG
jgi:hypothetical protein